VKKTIFFVDDAFLRMLGISLAPFDMIWLMETLEDYARELLKEETQKEISNSLKENRLLYELGEITREEYEQRNKELNQKLKKIEKVSRMNLKQRINILG